MIYKSGQIDCFGSYEYIKSILKNIGNITGFKAFKNNDHKYYEINKYKYKDYYNLILFDDIGNEIWLDSNCGYPGSGPACTEKILQIVGLRDYYRIDKDARIFKKHLVPDNRLKLIVVFMDSINDEYHIKSFVNADFNSSYERYEMVEALKYLGHINSLKCSSGYSEYIPYFDEPHIDDEKTGEYTINNVLFLNRRMKDISSTDITKLLKTFFRGVEDVEIENIDKEFVEN